MRKLDQLHRDLRDVGQGLALVVILMMPLVQAAAQNVDSATAARRSAEALRQVPGGVAPTVPKIVAPTRSPQSSSATPSQGVVKIQEFRFLGNTAIPLQDLQALVADYVSRSLTFSQLESVAELVENYYRQRGFVVAQAFLPKQQLSAGVLTIRVVEGYCEAVDLRNDSHVATERLQQVLVNNACPAVKGESNKPALNLAELERSTLLVSDLLVSDLPGLLESPVRMTLAAGSKVGSTVVTSEIAKVDRLQGFVSLDNYGAENTGTTILSGGLDINSVTGQGDRLSLRSNAAEGIQAGSLDYVYPIGYRGLRLGGNFSQIKYTLKNFSGTNGDSSTGGLYLRYPFVRRVSSNVDGRISFNSTQSQDFLASAASQKKQVDILAVTLSADKTNLRGTRAAYGLTLNSGQLKLSAEASRADQSANKAEGGFLKLNYFANYSGALIQGTNLSGYAALNGQYASKNLDSGQKLSLVGSSAVRAFNGVGSVDIGNILTLELRYRLFHGSNYQSTYSLFYDHGAGSINVSPQPAVKNSLTIAGAGAGIVFSRASYYSLSIYHAQQTQTDDSLDTDATGYTWVQGVLLF